MQRSKNHVAENETRNPATDADPEMTRMREQAKN